MKFAAVGRIGLRSHRQTTVNGLSRFYSSAFTMRDSLMKSAISSLDIGVAFEREEEAVHMAFQSASKSTVAWVDGEDEVSAEVDPFALVAADVRKLNKNVKDLLGSDHPVLSTVAQYFFDSESQGAVSCFRRTYVAWVCMCVWVGVWYTHTHTQTLCST